MFMAEKPIITEEVKKQNNMAFKMRSGNKVSFKNMGSSPARNMKDGSYEHSFESPAKQGYNPTPTKEEQTKKMMEIKEKNPHADKGKGYTPISKEKMRPSELERGEDPHKDKGKGYNPTPKKYGPKKSPTKQKLNKGGEGQDQDKIFNSKGEHIGDYVNDKPVMRPGFKRPVVKKDTPVKPKEGDMEKYSDLEKYDDDRPVSPNKQAKTKGLGPRTAFGGVKNPELTKTKKPFSTKVMKDGPEKQVTGIDLGKDPHWQPHPDTFKTKKKKSPNKQKIQRTKELAPSLRGRMKSVESVIPRMHEVDTTQQIEMPQQAIIKTPIIPDYHTVKEKGKKKMISTTPQSDYYDPTYKRRTKAGRLATKVANVFRSDKKDKNVNVRKKKK